MTSRFARKRKSNEENEGPKELKAQKSLAKKWREDDEVTQISGRVKCIELENFMCHEKLKVEFDLENNNCFYIGGPNGSGKSALFAAMNIGLGGRGNHNDRGNSVKNYIKEGRRQAKIRITLTNGGQSSHPSYGEYSIVERTINQSNSTYVLKSLQGGKEIRVSTRKGDLDKLMNRYGIQLVNPIFWMSQDRSRHFLQQMKPEKLYEIFVFATELDSTRENYKEMEQLLDDVSRLVAVFDRRFGERRAELKKMAEHRAKLVKIDEKQNQLAAMGWMLLWLPLRDVIADFEALDVKKAELNKSNAELKERIEKNRQERSAQVEYTEQLNKSIGTLTDASAAETAAFRATDGKKKEIEREIRGINESIGRLKSSEREEESQIKTIQADIKKREDALVSNGKANEKMIVERKLMEIEENMTNIGQQCMKDQKELESMKEHIQQKQKEVSDLESEKYQRDSKYKRACEDLQKSAAVSKNALARFGRDVPFIIEIIKNNANRFEFEPVGPIGEYVNVRDDKWTFAVESAIGKSLVGTFVIHSQKDRQTLFDLCRQQRLQPPNVIVTNFRTPPHDTRRNEPDRSIITVERIIHFSNSVVRNCLIDVAKIESVMLIDSDEEAREILDGRCPINIGKAFTRTGGSGSGRNNQGGVYRFYPNSNPDTRPVFLMKKTVYDVDQLNHIIDTEKRKVQELEMSVRKARQVVDGLSKMRQQLNIGLGQKDQKKNELMSEKRKLQRLMEDMGEDDEDDSAIHHLKESITEIRNNIKKNHEERDELIETRKKFEAELTKARAAVTDAKKRVEEAQNGSGPLEEKLKEVKAEIDRMDATFEKLRANQKLVLAELDTHHGKLVALDKRKEKADERAEQRDAIEFKNRFAATGGIPPGFTDPPNFDEFPATQEAEKAYEDLLLEVNAAKDALNAASYNDDEYKDAVKEYNEQAKRLRTLKKIGKSLEGQKKDREENLPILRHAITVRLKNAFYKLMGMRDFRGILRVKHKEKIIDIQVLTHGTRTREERNDSDEEDDDDEVMRDSDDDTRKAKQDLKGLSGGERSYTTACFIMSLWEIMEAPFRCMDEFDVFMDMVNRKVVMELLVKLATEQFAHNQFIFFTPQGIRELGRRDKVQIFEMPKVRD